MESLRASYNEEDDEEWSDALEHIPDNSNNNNNSHSPFSSLPPPPPMPPATSPNSLPPPPPPLLEDPGSKENGGNPPPSSNPTDPSVPFRAHDNEVEDNEEEEEGSARKRQKLTSSSSSSPPPPPAPVEAPPAQPTKKPKKKSNNVWTKSSSRKGKKKNRSAGAHASAAPEDTVLITPIPRFPDKSDDAPDACICLSRVYKAERVELSDDRLTAGSTKGYRMVRATRGVADGAWFFEIKVLHLGETGHTRLGWTTEKGDLQAPVGYDGNSFGYRDIDGTKVHKALREKYGEESYKEGDVIGFYINLPEGVLYLPKPPHLVWYKGQRYMYSADGKDEPPKIVPGELFYKFS